MQQLQVSEATAVLRRIFFHAVDATDGITPETGLTGTGFFSENGATPVASSGSIVEINATNMPGRYYIEGTAAELSTVGVLEFRYKAAACAEVIARAQVVNLDPYAATWNIGKTGYALTLADWNVGKTGYSLTQAFPANFASLSISAGGLVDILQTAADKVWATAARILTASTNFNDVSTAEVNAEVLDVMNVDVITLPGQEAPPLTPTAFQVFGWMHKMMRNKKEENATEFRLYNDAGTVVDSKATVSDTGTLATKEEHVSGP